MTNPFKAGILDFDEVMTEAENQLFFGTSNAGFCISCGAERDGCEPDARNYHCEECEEDQVFAASELIIIFGS